MNNTQLKWDLERILSAESPSYEKVYDKLLGYVIEVNGSDSYFYNDIKLWDADCEELSKMGVKEIEEQIEWNFDTLSDSEKHDSQVSYSIEGRGVNKGREYIGVAVYTYDELEEIIDIELR